MPPKKYPVASTSVPSVQCSETPEIILPSDPIPEHETCESEALEELCQSSPVKIGSELSEGNQDQLIMLADIN